MNNAIKYSEGDLEITLRETGEIIFTNTARGLNEVEVGKLFDRFFTADKMRTGRNTGLGLAIVKALAEQMGCTLQAELEDGRFGVRIAWKPYAPHL